MKLKAGDTYPDPSADLNADVTGAAVRFKMMHLDGTEVFMRSATIDTPATGLVHYGWQTGDTDLPGAYRCEFEVTYANGDIQSFPQGSYLEILIRPAVTVA